MKYLDLLGRRLKDDFINDLFETYDVEVIYDYDRNHENMPDRYRAEIPDLGLEFVFDENQIFLTLFIDQKEIQKWNPFQDDQARLKKFSSKSSAREFAKENEISVTEGKAEFMGTESDWIRFDFPAYSIHYGFVSGILKKLTIQNKNEPNQ
ncbi:MAG: hypothetical protein Q8Q84_12525 [Hydrogenophaga sp.]|nr:hypothetical protein [Hydrogenophaga sp.]MDP3924174.1 hypothetical protein [Hydrogenophaga sp.]